MPESIVQVTEGTGKKLHTFNRTIGANSVEDEVVLFGHPYEAVYFVEPGAVAATATTASHLVQIMAGASLPVYVHRIVGYLTVVPAATTLQQFYLRRLTTAGTGGTAGGQAALDSTDAAPGFTSMTLPTVKGTEGAVVGDIYGVLPNAFSATGIPPIAFDFDYRGQPHLKVPRIPAGTANGICVRNGNALAVATLIIVATISEINF